MITINGESELIEIQTYQQLLERPRFQANLDPKLHDVMKLKLVGIYTFRAKAPCGLTTCHTPHNRGYVTAAEDGTETNIGNVCGRRLLGAENFTLLKRTLHADIRAKKNREVVRTFQAQIPELRQSLKGLREHSFGASWAWLTLAQLELPHRVWPVLENMVRGSDGRLMVEREATEQEIAIQETRGRKEIDGPRYVQAVAGYIDGIQAKHPSKNLRDLLSYGILAHLDRIEKIDADTARAGVVADAAKWIPTCGARVQEVQEALEAARRFLTKSNLLQFRHILNSSETEYLRRCVAKLPQAYQPHDTEAA